MTRGTQYAKTATRMERLLALVNHPNTPEHERAVAQQFLERLRAKQAVHVAQRVHNTTWYGAKYDHSNKLSTVEIAKLIRDEIKSIRKVAAKTADTGAVGVPALVDPIGDAPAGIKVSVRSEYFSGGSSIDIRLSGIPSGWGWEQREDEFGRLRWMRTPALKALMDELNAVMAAYNHDGGDVMTDYFDVRFYGSVDTDWREQPRD